MTESVARQTDASAGRNLPCRIATFSAAAKPSRDRRRSGGRRADVGETECEHDHDYFRENHTNHVLRVYVSRAFGVPSVVG